MIKFFKDREKRLARRVLMNVIERMRMQEDCFYNDFLNTKMPSWEVAQDIIKEEISKLD